MYSEGKDNWRQYISKLLNTKSKLDNSKINLNSNEESFSVPALIKASVLMLDEMIANGSKRNIFVMPEKDEMIFLFTIIYVLHNIINGNIGKEYNINSIKIGTKLKLGRSVVEFGGIERKENIEYVIINAYQSKWEVLYDRLPQLQLADEASKCTPIDRFKEEYLAREAEFKDAVYDNSYSLLALSDYRTHLKSSTYYVAPVMRTKELFGNCLLGKYKLNDILMLGQADYEGNLRMIGPGQMTGVPAITLCSELYSIVSSSSDKDPIQSVIIDLSNSDAVNKQLSYIDDVLSLDKSVLCLCDTPNSSNLLEFEKRGFNIWRWNKHSITPELLNGKSCYINNAIKNCAKNSISYIDIDDDTISTDEQLLNKYRAETNNKAIAVQDTYSHLNSVIFMLVRCISDIPDEVCEELLKRIENDLQMIKNEQQGLPPQMFDDFLRVSGDLQEILSGQYLFKKTEYIKSYVISKNPQGIIILVSDKSDCNFENQYWKTWTESESLFTKISVISVSEFLAKKNEIADRVFVCGWFKRSVMEKILYSFIAYRYTVLLYPCEKKWQQIGIRTIQNGINDKMNEQIISSGLLNVNSNTQIETFEIEDASNEQNAQPDELEQITETININRVKRLSNTLYYNSAGSVEAVPVTFAGDLYAFYRIGHQIVTVTKIIEDEAEDIEYKYPDDLKMGDFIVVSEAEKDLMREIGKQLLEKNGNIDAVKMAGKWRESIEVEKMFRTEKDIIDLFVKSGIKRDKQTFKKWITDDEMIAPAKKEDILAIAKVLKDSVLTEMSDDVIEAAELVRGARQSSGRSLAETLRNKLPEQLASMGEVDPYNIWKPIEISIENIGKIRILKIIDINDKVYVDSTSTDRLIRDNV